VASTRTPFEKLTPIHPNRRITLETGATPVATRLMDLLVPVGFGQRALVVAPPKAGKTTILRQIAAAVLANHPGASLFLCLVDERPEEVTDWRTEVQGPLVKLYASSFDQQMGIDEQLAARFRGGGRWLTPEIVGRRPRSDR